MRKKKEEKREPEEELFIECHDSLLDEDTFILEKHEQAYKAFLEHIGITQSEMRDF